MQSLPGGNAVTAQDNFSSLQMMEAAFRHRRLWLGVVVCVVLASLAYTTLRPKQYRSEMDILIQNTRGDGQITPSRVNGMITVNGVTEEQVNSEIQLLQSRGLADVVIDPQWNSRPVETLTQKQLKDHEKALNEFEKHLTVELVRKSNVIHTTYTASDPRIATQTLDRLLTGFMAKQREISQPPGTAEFFTAEAARYKSQLDQAQQELAQFQQKNQIVSLADTEQEKDREINDAETELRATDAQISEDTQRIGTQTRQLKSIPARQRTQQRIIPNDYSIERLNTMLAELRNQRTSLLTKFTPEDRLVQEVDRKIADTQAALEKAQHMTSEEDSSDVNPVWQSTTGSIIQNETDRQALRAKRDALTEQVAKLRGNLSNAEGSTVAFTTLRQKVTDLENNYQLYLQKSNDAKMADLMNEDRLLNVAVQQSPTYSVTPFRPKPVEDMVLGSFTAIFLASFIVFFAEVGRDTIANPRELERVSRFPVLATIPMDRIQSKVLTEQLCDFFPVFIGMETNEGPASARRASPALVRLQQEGNAE